VLVTETHLPQTPLEQLTVLLKSSDWIWDMRREGERQKVEADRDRDKEKGREWEEGDRR